MYEISWNLGEPASQEVLRSVEETLSVALPADYRSFVREHNGARPRPNAVDLPDKREVVMERLLRLDSGANENVSRAAQVIRRRRPGLVPFGRDPFGNLFCFQYSGKSISAVVFWDHESGLTSTVCKSFSELTALLHPPRR
jgi:cell wall assembly regulator SMI1